MAADSDPREYEIVPAYVGMNGWMVVDPYDPEEPVGVYARRQLAEEALDLMVCNFLANYDPPDGWQTSGPDLREMQIASMKLK